MAAEGAEATAKDIAGRNGDSANGDHPLVVFMPSGRRGRFPVGTLLRILPNHACATAAQHPQYYVIAGEPVVEAVWPRFSGW